MSEAEARARRRRLAYSGAVVAAGSPKPRLREPSPTVERLAEMWQLCVRQWIASGRPMPIFERATMPGEIFRIDR